MKKIGLAGGVLLLLLVVAYFVCSSAAFFKGVILPRVSRAAGATVTVQDASLSPFSSVTLTGLKVQTGGGEPLLAVKEVIARYSLFDIIRGRINVEEVSITEPVLRVVVSADGTSNLDVFTKKKAEEKKPVPAGSPPSVDVKKLVVRNALLRYTQFEKDGRQLQAELAGLTFSADDIKNGQTARLNLGATLKLASGAGTNLAELLAPLSLTLDAGLGPDLQPRQVKSSANLTVNRATGAFADAAKLNAKLAVDLTPTDLKQFALDFSKDGKALGAITGSGPFDAMKREGKLKISVTGLGNQVLSLVGGRYGIYFGGTTLAAEYDIELKDQARVINTAGRITADQFSLTRGNFTTPVVNLQLGYSLTVDLPKTNALVRSLTFSATQAGRPLVQAALAKEILLDWSKGSAGMAESAFELTVPELNLPDWRAFVGSNVTSGMLTSKLTLNLSKAGKLIQYDLSARLSNLAAQFGSNKLNPAGVELSLRGQLTDFSKLAFTDHSLRVTRVGQTVVSGRSSGQLDTGTQDAEMQSAWEASLPRLSALLGRTDVALSDGTLRFTGRVTQKNQTPGQTNSPVIDRAVAASLQVTNLTGHFQSYQFDRWETAADLDVDVKNNVATLKKCAGALKQAGQDGGGFDVSGNYNLASKAGEIVLKLRDLNQHALRSFAAAALAPMVLEAVSLSAEATARFNAQGDSSATGTAQVAKLLISDPQGRLPRVPLAADLKLDAALNAKGVADLKQFSAQVRQGEKAAGNFEVTGQFDLTNKLGRLALKLADLNQNALAPFLAPALAGKTLESVSINATADAQFNAQGDSSAKASFNVANLLVSDPTGPTPKTPLALRAQLDAAMSKHILDLRQAQLALAPTDRARNELALAGKVDLSKSNAITGSLKLTAESLDFTPYYDMLAAQKTTNPTTRPAAPASEVEPPAKDLGLQNFTFDAEIGRLFLRELAVSNLVMKTKIDGGKVDVNSFALSLNGAPVSAKALLNLGVPGYEYDANFQATQVPLAPLVNSFQPERKGQIGGTVTALAQVKGAGLTGASVQKNLTGQFDISSTNLNLQVVNIRMPILKTILNAIIGIPDMIRNPGAIVGNLLGSLGGSGGGKGGWVDEVTKPPIEVISARGRAGGGLVELQQAVLQSPAFQAGASGTITLAPAPTNRVLALPVEVFLRRDLAEKVGLAGNTPTNDVFAKLPQFVAVKGTASQPKTDINYPVLLAAAAKAGAGVIGNTGKAVVDSIGGFLGGKSAPAGQATNAPASTNEPPKKKGLFDLFK